MSRDPWDPGYLEFKRRLEAWSTWSTHVQRHYEQLLGMVKTPEVRMEIRRVRQWLHHHAAGLLY